MFLYLIGKINPQAWDALIPHGPRVSSAAREYLVALALKGFAAELGDRAVSGKLATIQKTLVTSAGSRLAADYDDDNWCGTPGPRPPGPFLGPHPEPWFLFSEVMLNPQQLPPKDLRKEIGGYLLLLSEATSHEDAAKELQSVGNSLIR